jgi:serine/threonine-protein kinase
VPVSRQTVQKGRWKDDSCRFRDDQVSFTVSGYTIYERLGSGARATIWLAENQRTGEMVALKRVVRRATDDDRFLIQAQNDFEISHKLTHPYLRKSYELRRVRKLFQTRELHILMEYVDGRTLEQVGALGTHGILGIFVRVAHGLDALHQMGYIHTDIKPNNIMIGNDGEVKIIDFGLSCKIGQIKERIQGTPDYIAPEQVERRIPLDQRTDVYNFGATLYWAITGQNFPTVMPSKKRSTGIDLAGPKEAQLPEDLNPNVPTALSRLVMDCCKQNPQDRPGSMGEVIRRLELAQHILDKNQATLTGPAIRGKRGPMQTLSSPSGDTVA